MFQNNFTARKLRVLFGKNVERRKLGEKKITCLPGNALCIFENYKNIKVTTFETNF